MSIIILIISIIAYLIVCAALYYAVVIKACKTFFSNENLNIITFRWAVLAFFVTSAISIIPFMSGVLGIPAIGIIVVTLHLSVKKLCFADLTKSATFKYLTFALFAISIMLSFAIPNQILNISDMYSSSVDFIATFFAALFFLILIQLSFHLRNYFFGKKLHLHTQKVQAILNASLVPLFVFSVIAILGAIVLLAIYQFIIPKYLPGSAADFLSIYILPYFLTNSVSIIIPLVYMALAEVMVLSNHGLGSEPNVNYLLKGNLTVYFVIFVYCVIWFLVLSFV